MLNLAAVFFMIIALTGHAKTNRATISEVPPTVSFCDLMRHPDNYDGKIVVVSATLGNNHEYSYFFDDTCKASSSQDEVYALSTFNKGTYKFGSPLDRKLDKLLGNKDGKLQVRRAWVKVVAIFTDGKSSAFGHMNCCRYKLEVQQLVAVDREKPTTAEKSKK